ncbi:MAG TPA: hypothetical protein VGD65_25705 [Chryseosolibacter sp.]
MYYNVRLDWDPKIIGVKNGIYQVELDKSVYDKNSYAKLDSLFISNEFNANQVYPEIDFIFYFKKLKSAKKTDFISFSPNLNHCQFLVQKDILELLRKFNIQRHKDYQSVIYDSQTEHVDNNYRLFYTVLQDWNVIDFENTIFTSGGFGNNLKVEHKFTDENEMKMFKGITKVKTLVLSKAFDSSLDFFLTRLGGLFVSEKLKLALEEKDVTGIKLIKDVEVLM